MARDKLNRNELTEAMLRGGNEVIESRFGDLLEGEETAFATPRGLDVTATRQDGRLGFKAEGPSETSIAEAAAVEEEKPQTSLDLIRERVSSLRDEHQSKVSKRDQIIEGAAKERIPPDDVRKYLEREGLWDLKAPGDLAKWEKLEAEALGKQEEAGVKATTREVTKREKKTAVEEKRKLNIDKEAFTLVSKDLNFDIMTDTQIEEQVNQKRELLGRIQNGTKVAPEIEEEDKGIAKKFKDDPAMKDFTLGSKTDEGYEVFNKSGELAGYYE